MAKLNKTTAKKVDAAKSGFDPIPDGTYHMRLRDVDASREGPAGPYWSWEFEVVEEGDHRKARLWTNTSLSDAAFFKLKEAFDAFSVSTDTDTDELLGQVCRGVVSVRTIQKGARKGEETNQIDKLIPKDPEFVVPEDDDEPVAAGAGLKGGGDDDIPF